MPSQFPNPPDSFPEFGLGHGFHDAACQTQPPHSISSSPNSCPEIPSSDDYLETACRARIPSSSSSSSNGSCQESITSSTDQEDLENGLQNRSMAAFYNFLCQPSVEECLRRQEAAFENSPHKQHSSRSSSPLRNQPHTSRITLNSSQSSISSCDPKIEVGDVDTTVWHLVPRKDSTAPRNGALTTTPADHPPLPNTEIARGFFKNAQEHEPIVDRPSPRGALDEWYEATRNQWQPFYRYTSSFRDSAATQSRDITEIGATYLESLSSGNTIFSQLEQPQPCLESPISGAAPAENPELQLEARSQNAKEEEPLLIEFAGPNDPERPMNWRLSKKCIQTFVLVMLTFTATFASSIFSTAGVTVAKLYGVSQDVTVLGVSLFVLGFFVGPSVWGPFSELYGRKTPLLIGFFGFAIFQIPVAVAQTLRTILVCRFFGGVFGSAPLAITGGALADIWDPVDRGVAICFFSGATFLGPVIGPIAGGFITKSDLGWRWTAWIVAIIAFPFFIAASFFFSESYAPLILQRKAKKLRYQKKQWGIHSKLDEKEHTAKEILENYLLRPTMMFIYEPILLLVTIYAGFIYGILYLFFVAYPITFQEVRGYNSGIGSLPFLGITVGVFVGCAIIIYTTKTRFKRKLQETGNLIPEERLLPMIIGAVIFPIGIFLFGWTSSPRITWVPQVIAGIATGAGILMIFLQSQNYIIDVYTKHTNSALATNTMIRSLFGAGFPMFARAMFHGLGINWACTLLGIIAAVLVPVPIVFFKYGRRIRKWSRYANIDEEDDPEDFEAAENPNGV